MSLKKRLKTNDTIEAWTYDTDMYKGISVGVFDRMRGNSKAVVSVESADTLDGIVKRIVLNKEKAEKHGFKIVIE